MSKVRVKEKMLIEKEVIKSLLAAAKLAYLMPDLEMRFVCSHTDLEGFETVDSFTLVFEDNRIYLNVTTEEGKESKHCIAKDGNIDYPWFQIISDKGKEFILSALIHSARVLSNGFETNAQRNFEANCACLDILKALEG